MASYSLSSVSLRTTIVGVVIAVLAMIFFFGPTDNWVWDASIYYAQLRSPLVENNLDFRNEILTNGVVLPATKTGLVGAMHPIGPAILWAPFFVLAHSLTLIIAPHMADGYSPIYIALVSFGSVLYGIAGVWLIYGIGRHFGDSKIAAIVALLSLFATPLFFYTFRQPIISHSTNIFVASLMVLAYVTLEKDQAIHQKSGLIFGTLAGFAFLTRWTGALLVLYPLSYFLSRFVKAATEKDKETIKIIVQQLAIAMLVGIAVISPQIVLWKRIYGTYLAFPQMDRVFLVDGPLPIYLDDILFNTSRGLLFWAPITVWGLVGLFWIPNRRLRWLSVLYVAFFLINIGYRIDWYSGGAVGQRYVIELLPVLAIGAVCLTQRLVQSRRALYLFVTLAILLIAQQAVLVFSIERSHSGWMDVERYFTGQPIGIAWFFTNSLRLLKEPLLWFSPRPYVALDRQTIACNLFQGVSSSPAYYITGIALLSTCIAAPFWPIAMRVSRPRAERLLIAAPLYMVAWAVYLARVG